MHLLGLLLCSAGLALGSEVDARWPVDPPLPGEALDGWPGLGAPVQGEVLHADEAVRRILARHPELGALALDVEAARADVRGAGRVPGPTFDVAWLPYASGPETDLRLGVDLTDLGLAGARAHVARAALTAEQARTRVEAVRLGFRVRETFLAHQAAEAQRQVIERSFDAQAAARDLARALVEAGSLPRLDLVTQEAAYENLRQQVAAARVRSATTRRAVEALLGGTTDWSPAPLAPLPAEPRVPADLEVRAEAESLELAALRARGDALSRGARVALAEGLLPELNIGLEATWAPDTAGTFGLGVEGSIPLFGVGAARQASLSASAGAVAARADQGALDVGAAARAAADTARIAHARAVHLETVVVPMQREVLHETLLQYNAMQIGAWQLLAALRAELDASSAAIEAARAWWVARAAVDALLAGARVEVGAADAMPASAPTPSGAH